MTKSQLTDIVAKKAHLTKKAAAEAIEALFDEMNRSLAKGDKVVISGFGTFYVSQVKGNPQAPRDLRRRTAGGAHGMVLDLKAGASAPPLVWPPPLPGRIGRPPWRFCVAFAKGQLYHSVYSH